jgi:hypothetical protein
VIWSSRVLVGLDIYEYRKTLSGNRVLRDSTGAAAGVLSG